MGVPHSPRSSRVTARSNVETPGQGSVLKSHDLGLLLRSQRQRSLSVERDYEKVADATAWLLNAGTTKVHAKSINAPL